MVEEQVVLQLLQLQVQLIQVVVEVLQLILLLQVHLEVQEL